MSVRLVHRRTYWTTLASSELKYNLLVGVYFISQGLIDFLVRDDKKLGL